MLDWGTDTSLGMGELWWLSAGLNNR